MPSLTGVTGGFDGGKHLNDGLPDTWGDSLVSVIPNQVLASNATGNIISLVKTASSVPNSLVLRDSFSAICDPCAVHVSFLYSSISSQVLNK